MYCTSVIKQCGKCTAQMVVRPGAGDIITYEGTYLIRVGNDTLYGMK